LSQFNDVGLGITEAGWREEHTVDDVCNAIACQVVCTNDLLEFFDAGSHIHTTLGLDHVDILALHCSNTLEELQVCGQDLSRQHVVGEDVDELILVLRLQQAVQGAFWKSTEGIVGWGKDGEWAW